MKVEKDLATNESFETHPESPSSCDDSELDQDQDEDHETIETNVDDVSRSLEMDDVVIQKLTCCGQFQNLVSGFLFPKMTPIKWSTFFILFILIMIPVSIYITLFSKMGFGYETFDLLKTHHMKYGYTILHAISGFAFFLYISDCYYWSFPMAGFLRKFFFATLAISSTILVLIASSRYPYGPGCLFVIYTTFWLIAIQKLLYRKVSPRTFVSWLSGPLFFASIVVSITWIVWIILGEDSKWNVVINLTESEKSGCSPDYHDYPFCRNDQGNLCFITDPETNTLIFEDGCDSSCVDVYRDCYNPFIIWIGPFIISLGLLFLSFSVTILRSGKDISPETEASKFVRLWVILVIVLWIGSNFAGVGAGVSTTLAALTLSLFVASSVFFAISFENLDEKRHLAVIGEQFNNKFGNLFDILRGLLMITCTPFFLVYFAVSFIKQSIRTWLNNGSICCKNDLINDDENNETKRARNWLTPEVRILMDEFRRWNRTKIFTYAVIWGAVFVTLYVFVSKYTVVFLSWLIEELEHEGIGTMTCIMIGIGLMMFLLPIVPGAPIYLALGLVVVPVCRDEFGILGSIAYGVMISFFIKLTACTMQQKIIGGLLQRRVSVRKFCRVNSNLMRSMKLVLQHKGIRLDKVCILVGGPDWPTSVLCGIMGLDLIPVLLGTTPIIFLIIPTLTTGALTYMSNIRLEDGQPEFPMAGTVAGVFAGCTFLVQFGSMALAAYFLERTVSTRQEDFQSILIDEEVKNASDENVELSKSYEIVRKWEELPLLAKFTLSTSMGFMITACYMVQIFNAQCFKEYQLTYTIDQNLDGDWKNLIKPLGLVANILFLVSLMMLLGFHTWVMKKARLNLKAMGGTIPIDDGNQGASFTFV